MLSNRPHQVSRGCGQGCGSRVLHPSDMSTCGSSLTERGHLPQVFQRQLSKSGPVSKAFAAVAAAQRDVQVQALHTSEEEKRFTSLVSMWLLDTA